MALRVMWLYGDRQLLNFEVQMLQSLGILEIYLPKIFPVDVRFRNFEADVSLDETLNIPAEDLKFLNAIDWYQCADPEVWKIASKYFDLVCTVPFKPEMLVTSANHFSGALALRALHTPGEISYGDFLKKYNLHASISKLGRRFFVAEAYPHIPVLHEGYIQNRCAFLPAQFFSADAGQLWSGEISRVYLHYPDIAVNSYSKKYFEEYKKLYSEFEYVIGGFQSLAVNSSKIIEDEGDSTHENGMAKSRLMFYQSTDAKTLDPQVFKALSIGMPLIFMAGGMLDRLGGAQLPGRCSDIYQAKSKIARLLKGDSKFIDELRSSQKLLLDNQSFDKLKSNWGAGLEKIEGELEGVRGELKIKPDFVSQKKVAVILPVGYKGGSLRAVFTVSKALYVGSRQANDPVEVVFSHLDDESVYHDEDFAELDSRVKRRPLKWTTLTANEARRAMRYAGHADWEPDSPIYMIPDDGAQQFLDCGVWVIISDRFTYPILPLRPIVLIVYDYVQRYVDVMSFAVDIPFLRSARSASRVLVTTEFTRSDALSYAGINPEKIGKVPALAPEFPYWPRNKTANSESKYFVWTTNAAPHKNHKNALEALRIYYEELAGLLRCIVTGVNTDQLMSSSLPHLSGLSTKVKKHKQLQKNIRWRGDLSDVSYRKILGGARFLWHPAIVDNGTFSVIEAAYLGVPSLSSDYPAMMELNDQFSLNLALADPFSPRKMALALKNMESSASLLIDDLPDEGQLNAQSVERLAFAYWNEVRKCM